MPPSGYKGPLSPHEDQPIKIPLLGFIAVAFVSLAFAVGAFDALVTNHFTSWKQLTLRPDGGLARAIEGLLPVARAVTMAGAAAFGYTTLRRLTADTYRRAFVRLGLLTFSPIVVELTDFGTQDGQVKDLDKLPVHSMVLMVLLVLGPALVALRDFLTLRGQRRSTTTVG